MIDNKMLVKYETEKKLNKIGQVTKQYYRCT